MNKTVLKFNQKFYEMCICSEFNDYMYNKYKLSLDEIESLILSNNNELLFNLYDIFVKDKQFNQICSLMLPLNTTQR